MTSTHRRSRAIGCRSLDLWEIAIKRSLGKLDAPDDLPERISGEGFAWLGVDAHVAQALVEHLPVMTTDPSFGSYGVEICR
jgi:PIN domain nuclease of toxin-antitoxin system